MGDYATSGRVQQKQRTRAALVTAARELMAETDMPSVAAVAERASVSLATAYRYFSTQEALLAEAAMAPLVSALEQAVEEAEQCPDVHAALDHFLTAVFRALAEHEAAFRLLYARSLEAAPTRGLEEELARGVGRGGRRPIWLRRVLAPLRGDLEERDFERLVSALTATIGVEALSALRDVCGASFQEAREVMRWSALSLLRAARQ